MAPCRHSSRRRRWYVKPLEMAANDNENEYSRNEGKILCGHLYNASTERMLSGLTEGDGEQCCIAMEDIADARLDFSATLCVHQGNPGLTGVQLTCGHRFSATHLLWHWCMSNMVCPVCRAEYKCPDRDLTRSSVENFPIASWRLLRGLLRTHFREIEEEEMRQIQIFERQNVIEDVMDVVFGSRNMFVLMLTLDVGDQHVNEYLPLHRTNSNFEALQNDLFRFSVQRASLRRFTAMLNRMTRTMTSQGGVVHHARILRPTILMRVPGAEYDDAALLLVPIIQVAEINIPVCPRVPSSETSTMGASDVPGGEVVTVSTTGIESRRVPAPPIFRYMNIHAQCIEVRGVLDLEMSQDPLTGSFDSLMLARIAIKASNLLQQVARFLNLS